MMHNTSLAYRTALRSVLSAISAAAATPGSALEDYRPQLATLDSLIYTARVLMRDWEHLEYEESEINKQAELARKRAAATPTYDISEIIG